MFFGLCEGITPRQLVVVVLALTAVWLFIVFEYPRSLYLKTYQLHGNQDALQMNLVPFLENAIPPILGVSSARTARRINLAAAAASAGVEPELFLQGESVAMVFSVPHSFSYDNDTCYATYATYQDYDPAIGVADPAFFNKMKFFNLTAMLTRSIPAIACAGPLLTKEDKEGDASRIFAAGWFRSQTQRTTAQRSINGIVATFQTNSNGIDLLFANVHNHLNVSTISFRSTDLLVVNQDVLYLVQYLAAEKNLYVMSLLTDVSGNSTSLGPSTPVITQSLNPGCFARPYFHAARSEGTIVILYQSDPTLCVATDNSAVELHVLYLKKQTTTIIPTFISTSEIFTRSFRYPFFSTNGYLQIEEPSLSHRQPNTINRVWDVEQSAVDEVDVTEFRNGPYYSTLSKDKTRFPVFDSAQNMGYFLVFDAQPAVNSQFYSQHPKALSPVTDSIPTKDGGMWDRAASTWDTENTPDSVYYGHFLTARVSSSQSVVFGLGLARKGTRGPNYYFLFSFSTNRDVPSNNLLLWSGFMWSSIIIAISVAFQFSHLRYQLIEEYFQNLKESALAKREWLRWKKKQAEMEGEHRKIALTCIQCRTAVNVPAEYTAFVCPQCGVTLRVPEAAPEVSEEKSEVDISEVSVDAKKKKIKKDQSGAFLRNEVVKLSVVSSDEYKRLSTFCSVNNIIHLVILTMEFWQLCSFAFSKKVSWTNKAGGNALKNLFKFAILDFQQMSIDIPSLTSFVVASAIAIFFVVGVFAMTTMWIRYSKLKLTKQCRMSPYFCFIPVSMLQPVTGVFFLPILRVIFSDLSCSKIVVPGAIAVLVLDFAPVICWQGIHVFAGVLSLISLVAFLPLAIFLFPIWQELTPNLEIRYAPSFLLLLPVLKLILVISTFFFTSYTWVEIATSFIVTLVLGITMLRSRPCCVWSINNLRIGSFFGACWSCVCSAVALALQQSNVQAYKNGTDIYPLYMLYAGWGVILFVGIVITYFLPSKKKDMKEYWKPHEKGKLEKEFDGLAFVDKLRLSYQQIASQKKENLVEG